MKSNEGCFHNVCIPVCTSALWSRGHAYNLSFMHHVNAPEIQFDMFLHSDKLACYMTHHYEFLLPCTHGYILTSSVKMSILKIALQSRQHMTSDVLVSKKRRIIFQGHSWGANWFLATVQSVPMSADRTPAQGIIQILLTSRKVKTCNEIHLPAENQNHCKWDSRLSTSPGMGCCHGIC